MRLSEYSFTAKALHWVVALFIFVLFPLGWVMGDFTGLLKFKASNLHKSLGLTVLTLMVLRTAWRLVKPAPALPAFMPGRQRKAAYAVHALLYVAIFLMAITGWAMISASDKPSVFFQLTRIPLLPWLSDLPAGDKKAYAEFFENTHGFLANVLLALVALHLAAALYHGAVRKDGILLAMMPRWRKSQAGLSILMLLAAPAALYFAMPGEALASEWSVKPEQSQISFEASGGGYIAKGTFARYRTEIEFDPELPEEASVRVLLDMNSAATGTADADATLKSADLLNPAQFPTAQYVAKGAKPVYFKRPPDFKGCNKAYCDAIFD